MSDNSASDQSTQIVDLVNKLRSLPTPEPLFSKLAARFSVAPRQDLDA